MLIHYWFCIQGTIAIAYAYCPRPLTSHSPSLGAVTISPNGDVPGSHSTFDAALKEISNASIDCPVLFVYEGCYSEHVQITSQVDNLQIIGQISSENRMGHSYRDNKVTLWWSHWFDAMHPRPIVGTVNPNANTNEYTSTLIIKADNVSVYNINIVNYANLDGQRRNIIAGAISVQGQTDNSGIGLFGISAEGWQDTAYFPSGNAIVRGSYLSGAVDYVYGRGKVLFENTVFATRRNKGKVFAQGQLGPTDDTIFVADHCSFDNALGFDEIQFWLARPWSQFSRVLVKHSYLGTSVYPEAWTKWHKTDDSSKLSQVSFSEFNNSGPGNWENNAAARWAFGHATLNTKESFTMSELFPGEEWIDHGTDNFLSIPTSANMPLTSNCGPQQ